MKRLELLVFLSVGVAVVCGLACRDVSQRVDCGYAGISAENCTTRGCCYGQQAGQPSCFFSEDGVTVETVHIIQSNHLDVGYADLSVNIVNEYFTKYFPRAARIGAELRARGGLERLRWMTHTYLVTLFLDCPSGLGLHCPDADAVATFKSAVSAGDITWHAFPYNAQLEVMDVSMVRFGLNLTHTIDDLFGLPHKKTLSQRDVPGMPRAVIPILVDNGVNAISIGCNGAVIPPNIPLGGVWRDDATNTSILTLQHPFGYGQLPNPSQNTPLDGDSLVLPGLSHAMVYAWRGDNAGPPESVEEVLANFAQVRAAFPTAKNVVASTLDNFTSLAQSVRHLLPVISQDQGDSWVLGPPSDPYKVAALRELHRQRAQCVDGTPTEAHCQCSAKEMFDFSRLALKNGEHTWGLSLGHMKDQSNYTNAYLQEQLASGDKASLLMEQSWKEQREWGITVPVSKLGASPFGAHVRAALDALEPRVPSTEGWHRESDPTREIALSKRVQLSFDATSGAVVSLVDSRTGVQWASSERPLARVLYNSLVEADFTRFQNEYLFVHEHFDTEYGKPNVTASNPRRQMLPPRLQSVWTRTAEGKFRTDILVELSYVGVSDVHEHYGAPETVWVEYASDDDDTSISVTLSLFNKTTTRFPEAAFFQFLPTYDAGETPQWEFRRLHGWTGLHDSVVGANRGMPGIDDAGIRLTRSHSNKTLSIASLDAGFVSFDDPSPFPSPLITQPDPFKGAAFTLWANPYNTNYPFWYPFDGRANLKYRFTLAL